MSGAKIASITRQVVGNLENMCRNSLRRKVACDRQRRILEKLERHNVAECITRFRVVRIQFAIRLIDSFCAVLPEDLRKDGDNIVLSSVLSSLGVSAEILPFILGKANHKFTISSLYACSDKNRTGSCGTKFPSTTGPTGRQAQFLSAGK